MILIVFGSFLGLILFVRLAENPGSKLIKNKSHKIHYLNILTAYMGGFVFVLITYLFQASHPDSYFSLDLQFFRARNWSIGNDNLGPFIFGFISTYIIIFLKNQYKKLWKSFSDHGSGLMQNKKNW